MMTMEELPEELLKLHEEFTSYRFHHVLVAPTSSTTKTTDETLTCLNQGQSYELRLRKQHGIEAAFGQRTFKSILRVIFHDRRLQYEEVEHLSNWLQNRPGQRLFDVELPLSFGLFDVHYDASNSMAFTWDSRQVVSVFVKINCISTEFTTHKRGGERGIPFRIQIETYYAPQYYYSNVHTQLDTTEVLLHCASCKINVFKPKGAERKNKIDLDRIHKLSAEEKSLYRPFSRVTEFCEMTIAHAYRYLEQRRKHQAEFDKDRLNHRPVLMTLADSLMASLNPGSCGSFSSSDESTEGVWYGQTDQPTRHAMDARHKAQQHGAIKRTSTSSVSPQCRKRTPSVLTEHHQQLSTPYSDCQQGHCETDRLEMVSEFCPEQVVLWMHTHRFHNIAQYFVNYSGSDMLKLSREQCILICGPADGIRLNNAIQARSARPRRTIYVCFECQQHSSGVRKCGSAQDDRPSSRSSSESSPELQHRSLVDSPSPLFYSDSSFPMTFSSPESFGVLSSAQFAETRSQSSVQVQDRLKASLRSKTHHDVDDDHQKLAVYQAVYLDFLTYHHLLQKLAQVGRIEENTISRLQLQTSRGTYITVSDCVVQNIADNSKFLMELRQDSTSLRQVTLLLKSLDDC